MVLVGLESIVVVSHSVMMNKTFVVAVEDDDGDDDDRDGIVDAVVTTLAMGMVVSCYR